MKTLVDFLQTVGKTVHAVSHTAIPGGIVVSFSDDTFTVVVPENDYEDYTELREGSAVSVNVLDGYRDEWVRIGVVTAQEWDQMKQAREQSQRVAEEANERRLLARLRAKYQ